ncbi:MAG: hypothetical protein JRF56_18780, partial [Deltaproteobacteria bacterium]|nr:hypothetical protein [Deltaproteobacteria bacterium]
HEGKILQENNKQFCPKCGYPGPFEFDECPNCRIFISKYQKMMDLKKEDSFESRNNALQEKNMDSQAAHSGDLKSGEQENQGRLSKYMNIHNLGEIIRDTVEIYRRNFLTLFLIQLMAFLFSLILVIPSAIIVRNKFFD